jgi:phosphoglycolate phosphatase
VTKAFVVFDLDGTLIDGYAAIANALGFAMGRLDLAPLPVEQVRGMVGYGLEKLVEQVVDPRRASEGVALFRERYRQIAIDGTDLMPGVPEVLAALSARGHAMAVASNKPAEFSRSILDAKGVGRYFLAVGGPGPETPAKPDPAMLRQLMEQARTGPAGTVVVGDMEVDSAFGRAARCRVVLVPGGSRSREELLRVDSDGLLDTLAQLPEWLALQSPAE